MAERARKRGEAPAAGETALYPPVKAFLEAQGYTVRGEVRGCDLVARRGDEPPVIVELKLRLTLGLLLQGVDRLALSDRVYLAVPRPPGRRRGIGPDHRRVRRLCRRLGLGLILVGARSVNVIEDPLPYRPPKAKRRAELLLGEFARRSADLNRGGSARMPIVTAYREEALRCARALADRGPLKLAELRIAAAVPRAAAIMQRNVYGWFARTARATYGLSAAGRAALDQFAAAIAALAA